MRCFAWFMCDTPLLASLETGLSANGRRQKLCMSRHALIPNAGDTKDTARRQVGQRRPEQGPVGGASDCEWCCEIVSKLAWRRISRTLPPPPTTRNSLHLLYNHTLNASSLKQTQLQNTQLNIRIFQSPPAICMHSDCPVDQPADHSQPPSDTVFIGRPVS
jgi:hypothetical protein